MRPEGIWHNIFRREETSEPDKDIAKKLRNVPIFSELGRREIQQVLQIAHQRHYEPNEVIVREGQPSAGMYIVLRGCVRITRRSAEGLEIELADMEEGDFFGDIGLLDNAPRTATVTSTTESEVLGFFRPELFRLIESDPKLACKILLKLAQVVAARLRFTDAQLERLAEAADRSESGEAANE